MRNLATPMMAAVILALVGLGSVLDRVAPATAPTEPVAPAVDTVAGAWICAVGDTAEGSSLDLISVAPPAEGGNPSALAVTTFAEGEPRTRTSGRVFPNSAHVTSVEEGLGELGAVIRWRDVPAAVNRQWRVEAEGRPSGLVAGPCQSEASDRWVVPGLATAGGAQARVVLANPFGSAASVAIDLTTTGGILSPRRLENVVVPARSVVEILLNEHAPERADLGAIVSARSGRVVVEAVQSYDAAIGGVEGVSLVLAAPQPAEAWTVPALRTTEASPSWLWITNPSEQESAFTISLHGTSGGVVPEGFEELTLAPGTTQRVELVGLLEGDEETSAATVTVENGVPVVVSGATQFRADAEERSGITVSLGATGLDASWVVTPGAVSGRTVLLDLVNPSGSAASVDVALWTGTGLVRPEELAGMDLPAGGTAVVDVTPFLDGSEGPVALFATATAGEFVAGLRAFAPDGRRDAVAFTGVPAGRFRASPAAPEVRFAPTLPSRLGTSRGPASLDEVSVDDLTGDGIELPDDPAVERSP